MCFKWRKNLTCNKNGVVSNAVYFEQIVHYQRGQLSDDDSSLIVDLSDDEQEWGCF